MQTDEQTKPAEAQSFLTDELEREWNDLQEKRFMFSHTKNWLRKSLKQCEQEANAIEDRIIELKRLRSN